MWRETAELVGILFRAQIFTGTTKFIELINTGPIMCRGTKELIALNNSGL